MVGKRRAVPAFIIILLVGSVVGFVVFRGAKNTSSTQSVLHVPKTIFRKTMGYPSTADLEQAFIHSDGGPLGGAAYSHVVPTLSRRQPQVVGFVFGFKYEGNGKASIDSPSDVIYLDAQSGELATKSQYSGQHRVMPAPTTDETVVPRMRELQDQLSSAFYKGMAQPPSELQGSAKEYLALFPRAVGEVQVVYYRELAPDWFSWLEASVR